MTVVQINPNGKQVVAQLEYLLKEAQSGKIHSFFYGFDVVRDGKPSGSIEIGVCGEVDASNIIFGMECLRFDLMCATSVISAEAEDPDDGA